MTFLIISAIYLIFSTEVVETPVAIISISTIPVVGSVALCYIAVLIRRTASSTSFFSTMELNLILATDSASLIIDSNYRGVAVMVFD